MINPFEAKSLSALDGVVHGFFTREGGVSEGLYASLNCGPGSRDEDARVAENRARVAAYLGAAPANLISLYQTHSARAVAVRAPWERDAAPQADAMVTDQAGLALGVLTADCVPVLLADGAARVVAAAHAGWRGALSGILEATVGQMEALGAERGRVRAAIGPAISARAYEVGEEFESAFLEADAGNGVYFTRPDAGERPHFDLPRYVADRLRAMGLAGMEDLGICTYAGESRLFSFRRATHKGEDDYGRQISAILLA